MAVTRPRDLLVISRYAGDGKGAGAHLRGRFGAHVQPEGTRPVPRLALRPGVLLDAASVGTAGGQRCCARAPREGADLRPDRRQDCQSGLGRVNSEITHYRKFRVRKDPLSSSAFSWTPAPSHGRTAWTSRRKRSLASRPDPLHSVISASASPMVCLDMSRLAMSRDWYSRTRRMTSSDASWLRAERTAAADSI